jgi:hemerythrin superfamily protein
MDAITLLKGDHNRVRGLFARFKSAHEADDDRAMTALAATIAEELTVHTTIEEEVFYPWARKLTDDIAESVDEGLEEHHVVKILLDEIAGLTPATDEWIAKMTVVIENVEHHAEEEETEMFPAVRGAASASDLQAQAEALEARKAKLGAPVLGDKIDLTDEKLHELATEQKIPGRSSMTHEELAAAVAPS